MLNASTQRVLCPCSSHLLDVSPHPLPIPLAVPCASHGLCYPFPSIHSSPGHSPCSFFAVHALYKFIPCAFHLPSSLLPILLHIPLAIPIRIRTLPYSLLPSISLSPSFLQHPFPGSGFYYWKIAQTRTDIELGARRSLKSICHAGCAGHT